MEEQGERALLRRRKGTMKRSHRLVRSAGCWMDDDARVVMRFNGCEFLVMGLGWLGAFDTGWTTKGKKRWWRGSRV